MTTALPFSEGLDDCSHSFIMSSYILFAHVWVHAAPEDVALRVITSAEWAASLAIGCLGMYGIRLLKAMFLFQI